MKEQDPSTTIGRTERLYNNLRIFARWADRNQNQNRNEENDHIEIGEENKDAETRSRRFKIDKTFLPSFLFCLLVMCLILGLLLYGNDKIRDKIKMKFFKLIRDPLTEKMARRKLLNEKKTVLNLPQLSNKLHRQAIKL